MTSTADSVQLETKSKSNFSNFFRPWKWNRKKKNEKIIKRAINLEKKISQRSSKEELIRKGVLKEQADLSFSSQDNPTAIFYNDTVTIDNSISYLNNANLDLSLANSPTNQYVQILRSSPVIPSLSPYATNPINTSTPSPKLSSGHKQVFKIDNNSSNNRLNTIDTSPKMVPRCTTLKLTTTDACVNSNYSSSYYSCNAPNIDPTLNINASPIVAIPHDNCISKNMTINDVESNEQGINSNRSIHNIPFNESHSPIKCISTSVDYYISMNSTNSSCIADIRGNNNDCITNSLTNKHEHLPSDGYSVVNINIDNDANISNEWNSILNKMSAINIGAKGDDDIEVSNNLTSNLTSTELNPHSVSPSQQQTNEILNTSDSNTSQYSSIQEQQEDNDEQARCHHVPDLSKLPVRSALKGAKSKEVFQKQLETILAEKASASPKPARKIPPKVAPKPKIPLSKLGFQTNRENVAMFLPVVVAGVESEDDLKIKLRKHESLTRFIKERPQILELKERNIIPEVTNEERLETRINIENKLDRRLSLRPTAEDLEEKHILLKQTLEEIEKRKKYRLRLCVDTAALRSWIVH